jgi:hypothetical protein
MTVEEFWRDNRWTSTCGICGERIAGNPPLPTDEPGVHDERGCRHSACDRPNALSAPLAQPERPRQGSLL